MIEREGGVGGWLEVAVTPGEGGRKVEEFLSRRHRRTDLRQVDYIARGPRCNITSAANCYTEKEV